MRFLVLVVALFSVATVARAQDDATLEREAFEAFEAFLSDRLEHAAHAYVALVDRLPPSTARDEALVMLAAIVADLDWDRDGLADAETPLARIARLVPADRAWRGALEYAAAHALYLSSHDTAAIALGAHARASWPPPESGGALAPACRRHRARPESLHRETIAEREAADVICASYGM